jgi:hypothetical protein
MRSVTKAEQRRAYQAQQRRLREQKRAYEERERPRRSPLPTIDAFAEALGAKLAKLPSPRLRD